MGTHTKGWRLFALLVSMMVVAPVAAQDDDTAMLQAAISSDADPVVVAYIGRHYVVGKTLKLRSNLNLAFAPGVVLVAKAGSFLDPHASMFSAKEIHDVSIVGYGATIRMRREDYKKPPYAPAEWRHGIALFGVTDIDIRGLTIEETGGDGIYVGPTWDDRRIACTNVHIADCRLDQNHRQGISVVSGVSVLIENCRITGTSGTAPQAGIDLEPSHPNHKMMGIVVRNCVAEGNDGSGFVVNLDPLSKDSMPVSIRIHNCLVLDSVAAGLRALSGKQGATGSVIFDNCTVQGTKWPGIALKWDTASRLTIRFDRCRLFNVAQGVGHSPISMDLVNTGPAHAGSVDLADVAVIDPGSCDVVQLTAPGTDAFHGVRGRVKVIGPTSPALERLPNLQMDCGSDG